MQWRGLWCLCVAWACGQDLAEKQKSFRLGPVKMSVPGTPEIEPKNQPPTPKSAVAKVFQRHCLPCHGAKGSADGGFDYAGDLARLASSPLVVAGQPDQSRLLQRIKNGDMPPAGAKEQPSPAEIQMVADWIQNGAQAEDPLGRLLSSAEVQRYIDEDFARLGVNEQRDALYVDLSHLYAGAAATNVDAARQALPKLINTLSRQAALVTAVAINPEATIYRVPTASLGWPSAAVEQLLAKNPFPLRGEDLALGRGGNQVVATKTSFDESREPRVPEAEAPSPATLPAAMPKPRYVRLDWLVKVASRPPFYYTLLEIPLQMNLLEVQLGIDTAHNLRQGRALRAGFANSQVASEHRVLERHAAKDGGYWRSFEFLNTVGNRNVFENPFGPGSVFAERTSKRFAADGHEVIFALPNGLLGFAVFDTAGNRLDNAPTGQNDGVRENASVPVGVACMFCHKSGLIDKQDQVRASFELFPEASAPGERELLQSLYGAPEIFSSAIASDSRRYRDTLTKMGIDPSGDEPIAALAQRYNEPLSRQQAAAYLGLSADELLAKVKASPTLTRLLQGSLAANALQRTYWESIYRQVLMVLRHGEPAANPVAKDAH